MSRQKVDIGAISITEIADQYLAEVSRMGELDLDVASDFLLVASTLLQIKAESLIPRDRADVDEEIAELAPSEARDILVERLVEYKKYKTRRRLCMRGSWAKGACTRARSGPMRIFCASSPIFSRV